MAQKKPGKKDKEKPELNQSKKELMTKPIKETSEEEIKPSFQELLRKKENSGPTTSEPEIEPIEADENIIEICKDLLGMGFEVWHRANPKVPPLSDSAKRHISQPMARMAAKYDVGRYFKDEFLFCGFLGFEIYKRIGIKKDDKNDNQEKGQGQDKPHT